MVGDYEALRFYLDGLFYALPPRNLEGNVGTVRKKGDEVDKWSPICLDEVE